MRNFVINTFSTRSIIRKEIYGHFAEHLGRCIYDGIFVGPDSPIPNTGGIRSDIVKALKDIRIPVLRWPGGCFADTYHWKDGIGPLDERKRIINAHWGGIAEDNSFGTHEFLTLCELLGCEPYLVGNVGSGTPGELSDWIDYVTGSRQSGSEMVRLRKKHGREEPWNVRYWGIGNENWGCGGAMTPEQYSDLYRTFAYYASKSTDRQLYRVACGANDDHLAWTEVVASRTGNLAEGMGLHKYSLVRRDPSVPGHRGHMTAVGFSEEEYISLLADALRIERLIADHSALLRLKSPGKNIDLVIDEWGNWHRNEEGTNHKFLYQQNTLLDALTAAVTLNIFNRNCSVISMANIAQTVNVLQAMILTRGEEMILTPTYHVFDLFKGHMGARLVDSSIETGLVVCGSAAIPDISHSVSMQEDGRLLAALANLDPHAPKNIRTWIPAGRCIGVDAKVLTADHADAHNTFEEPCRVQLKPFTGFTLGDTLDITLPPKSVCSLELEVLY